MSTANGDSGARRSDLADSLRAALSALEAGNDSDCRVHIEAAIGNRTSPAAAALAQLSRELNATLGNLPGDALNLGELPDACARLDHVVQMTEEATHRTLDLVEQCRALIARIERPSDEITRAADLQALRGNLTELALAQSHQDLCGQIIGRVVGLVGRIHQTLSGLGFDERKAGDAGPALAGPVVKGVDRHGVSQLDADSLLSDLGL